MSYLLRRFAIPVVLFLCVAACSSCATPQGRAGTWGVLRTAVDGSAEAPAPGDSPPPLAYGRQGEGAAEAAEAPTTVPAQLTVRDALLIALRANKAIRVASLDADASEARVTRAKGEFDPEVFAEMSKGRTTTLVEGDPLDHTETSDADFTTGIRQRIPTGTTLELAASTEYERELTGTSVIDSSYGPEVKVSVTQDLLKGLGVGVNRTDILIAQNNLASSEQGLKDTIIENLYSVERAYWVLYSALADLKVREQQLKMAEELLTRAQAKERVGRGAELDVTTAKSSVAAQRVQLIQLRNEVTKLRRNLLRLLGILDAANADAEFDLVDAPGEEIGAMALEEAVATALAARPDAVQAQLDVNNAELGERFARNQKLPRLQLFGEYALIGLDDELGSSIDVLDDGDYDTWQAGVRFEVPIPNRVARSDHQIARIGQDRALTQQTALVETVTREVADALGDLTAAQSRISTAIEARGLAEEVLRMRTKDLEVRGLDNLEVLRAQESLADAERDVISARTDYAVALANLYRVQGVLLEKRGVAFVPSLPGEE